jgi:hypothetical protein
MLMSRVCQIGCTISSSRLLGCVSGDYLEIEGQGNSVVHATLMFVKMTSSRSSCANATCALTHVSVMHLHWPSEAHQVSCSWQQRKSRDRFLADHSTHPEAPATTCHCRYAVCQQIEHDEMKSFVKCRRRWRHWTGRSGTCWTTRRRTGRRTPTTTSTRPTCASLPTLHCDMPACHAIGTAAARQH